MTALDLIDLAGVAVFAVSGALAAGRKHLDLIGVVVVATVTAIGGGTLRDLLMNHHPVFWITRPIYLYVILGTALLTVLYASRFHPPHRSLAVADAFGLAFFAISGAQIAEVRSLPAVVVIMMGTLTGVAGGAIRDILCAEIPMILRTGRIYATAAIAGAGVYLILQNVISRNWAALAGMCVVVGLRLGAIVWHWSIPVFALHRHRDE